MATQNCIFRINRPFEGALTVTPGGPPYPCGNGHAAQPTNQFKAQLDWQIGPPIKCDESKALWPDGLSLHADGNVIVRRDGFAYFTGSFSIVKISGKDGTPPPVTYFSGDRLELIFQSGSHQALAEDCAAPRHAEGWLDGRGAGPMANYSLSAALVAQWDTAHQFYAGTTKFPNSSINRLTGTLVKHA
ncbi:MAG: hypothetical protein HYR56_04325 [Acidobacteria bacterium]|nr:hypothetical protein [Acidobacteriota bacterium]MBI3421740.1 hypothetical protein [Acidobacteriota bacterium]